MGDALAGQALPALSARAPVGHRRLERIGVPTQFGVASRAGSAGRRGNRVVGDGREMSRLKRIRPVESAAVSVARWAWSAGREFSLTSARVVITYVQACYLPGMIPCVRESVDGQSAAAELFAYAFRQLRRRRFDALERIREAELVPLVAAHLVEAQDLDALDTREAGAEVGHFLDVVVPIGEPRNEDVADPHLAALRRQPARVVERRLERLTRDLLVDLGIAGLDVEQVQVDGGEVVVGELVAEPA